MICLVLPGVFPRVVRRAYIEGCYVSVVDFGTCGLRLQPCLPPGFVGAPFIQSGWCFVEVCGSFRATCDTNNCVAKTFVDFTSTRVPKVRFDEEDIVR